MPHDVMSYLVAYLDGTTAVQPADVVGLAHPRFAVAAIGSIIKMLRMSPPKSQPPRSQPCYHQEDWRDNNSQLIVAYRSHGAYVYYVLDPDRDNPIGSTDGLTNIFLPQIDSFVDATQVFSLCLSFLPS